MRKLTVESAKKIAKEYGLDGIIILGFKGEEIFGASYGRDKRRCGDMGNLMEEIFERIESESLVVWSSELGAFGGQFPQD